MIKNLSGRKVPHALLQTGSDGGPATSIAVLKRDKHWSKDVEGRYFYANPEADCIFGIPWSGCAAR